MNKEEINQFLLVFKYIVIVGIIAWNIVRMVRMRNCWKRKESCQNAQCKWWYFCDKHGASINVDIYNEKNEEMMKREQEEQKK